MKDGDILKIDTDVVGSLDISAYNNNVVPSIEFYEVADDNIAQQTGRSVFIGKEEWKGQTYACSNALVGFFAELVTQFGSAPKLQALMDHYGIEYRKEKPE